MELVNKLDFARVETCMKNRRDIPKFEDNLSQRGDSKALCNDFGSLAI